MNLWNTAKSIASRPKVQRVVNALSFVLVVIAWYLSNRFHVLMDSNSDHAKFELLGILATSYLFQVFLNSKLIWKLLVIVYYNLLLYILFAFVYVFFDEYDRTLVWYGLIGVISWTSLKMVVSILLLVITCLLKPQCPDSVVDPGPHFKNTCLAAFTFLLFCISIFIAGFFAMGGRYRMEFIVCEAIILLFYILAFIFPLINVLRLFLERTRINKKAYLVIINLIPFSILIWIETGAGFLERVIDKLF